MLISVKWDLEVDGVIETDPEIIPDEIQEIPDSVEEDDVSDYLSDLTGWCVLSWQRV